MNDPRDNDAGGAPRKPRIEVLRGAPAPAAAPAAGEARTHVFGGAPAGDPHGDAHVAPPPTASGRAEYVQPAERRRGGGLLRSPVMLLALLALAVLIGAIWYASLQREPDVVFDVPADPVRTETSEAADDTQVSQFETPPPNPLASEEAAAVEETPPEPAASARREAADVATAAPPAVTQPRTQPRGPLQEAAPVQEAAPAEDAAPAGGGSAVATARAFYSALSAGDGGSAAQLVVPAKRRSGPLSAGALTRYYSSFRRPLRVLRVSPVDENTVRVAYDYVLADGRLCRGSAAVDVVRSGGGSLVSGIRTRGPC
ncbi:MAG TPA: hypothetical protein VGB79_06790 [Allosphingosinicella sp.]|jgi:hypothetical protein